MVPDQMTPAETTVTSRDGFPLAVQTGGQAAAPVLLLLQGQANSHRWWDTLRGAIEPTYRTVSMDYRGTGRSRGPVDAWTTATFADDAADVLDALGVESVAVYGTSMGGRVAQMLAIRHPARVTALVLACTSPGGPHAVERGDDLRQLIARATPNERLHILRDLFYTAEWPHPSEHSNLLGETDLSAREARAHLRASDHHDAWDDLPLITARTLVLHGEDDPMTPAVNATLIADRIRGARLKTYAQGRHGFFDEYSHVVNSDVLEFLNHQVGSPTMAHG